MYGLKRELAVAPTRRLAKSSNLVDIGGISSAITDEEVPGLSEVNLNQLPRSPSDGRVVVDLISVGSVGM